MIAAFLTCIIQGLLAELVTASRMQHATGNHVCVQLCYVEKKSIKHLRRHKRNKHKIPWEKIKIEGPVTNCGSAAGSGTAKKSRCPVMH